MSTDLIKFKENMTITRGQKTQPKEKLGSIVIKHEQGSQLNGGEEKERAKQTHLP